MLKQLIENAESAKKSVVEYIQSTARRQSKMVVFTESGAELKRMYDFLLDLGTTLTPNGHQMKLTKNDDLLAVNLEFGISDSRSTTTFLKVWSEDPYLEEKRLIQYMLDNIKSITVEKMKAVCGMYYGIRIVDKAFHDSDEGKNLYKALAYRLCFEGYVRNKEGVNKLFGIEGKNPDPATVIRYGLRHEFSSVSRALIYKTLSRMSRTELDEVLKQMDALTVKGSDKHIDFFGLRTDELPSSFKIFIERKVRSVLDYNLEEVELKNLSIDDTAGTVARCLSSGHITDFFKKVLKN